MSEQSSTPGYGDQGPAGQGGSGPGGQTGGEATGGGGQPGPQGTNGRGVIEDADPDAPGTPATKGGMQDDRPGEETQTDLAGGSSSTGQ